jgi:hypothetical protein
MSEQAPQEPMTQGEQAILSQMQQFRDECGYVGNCDSSYPSPVGRAKRYPLGRHIHSRILPVAGFW